MPGAMWPTVFTVIVTVLMAAAFAGVAARGACMLRPDLASSAEGAGARPNRHALLAVALVVAGSRALLYLWAWIVSPWADFGVQWVQWDAPHYFNIARQWYVDIGVAGPDDHLMIVFFPLFPLLLRGVNALFGGDGLAAATALNLVCTMGAGCLLFRIVARQYNERKAWLALAYLLANPYAFFLGAPYPEALFLLLTLAAIDAAAQRRYLWAGLWGALSAFARVLGLVVAGVIVLEGVIHWLEARRGGAQRNRRLCARVLGGAAVVGLGFGAYLLINLQVTGAPFTFLTYQREHWAQQFGGFWHSARTTAVYMLKDFRYPDASNGFWCIWLPQAVAMAAVPGMLALRQHRLPLPWAAYAWAYLFAALAPTWLLSGPRYLMALAVLPVLQCRLTDRKWFHIAFVAVQGLLLLAYTYLYVVVRSVL